MKKVLLLAIISLIFFSCNNTNNTEKKTDRLAKASRENKNGVGYDSKKLFESVNGKVGLY